MSNFDVACLLVPHSGPTIIPISLTETACKVSTQAPCQAALKAAVLFLHVQLTECFHKQCSVYFVKNEAFPHQERDVL